MANLHGGFDNIRFIKQLLIGAPQRVGPRRAWDMYNDIKRGGFEYIDKLYGSTTFSSGVPTFESFEQFKGFHRAAVSIIQREEESAKRPKRRKAQAENEGYSETVVEAELTNPRFTQQHAKKSLVEDKWKSDRFGQLCASLGTPPSPQSDQFRDMYHRALIEYIRDRERPILTNEVVDFSNPYMMRKRATENLLHEGGCVRTKLEESLVDELLDTQSGDLIRLKSEGPSGVPGEVLEPLNAFRGLRDWSNDPQVRMSQKLDSINNLLKQVGLVSGDVVELDDNKIGFESTVPQGRTGGWGFGKPKSSKGRRSRYPTLQTVAHTMSKDPQFNQQVQHAINTLERSKGWTYEDKTRAVNTMKEVLDNLPSSQSITQRMEKALPIRTATERVKGGLVRYKPSNMLRRNRIRMYFRSMTATTSLAKRWTERRTKNAARAKKDKKK